MSEGGRGLSEVDSSAGKWNEMSEGGRGLSEVDSLAGKWNEKSEEGRGLELSAEKWVVMSQGSLQKNTSDKLHSLSLVPSRYLCRKH